MKKYIVTILLILSPLCAIASKMDGTWKGKVDSSYGLLDMTAVYQVSGEKVSGTITLSLGGQQMENQFDGGSISGDTFEYTYNLQGNSITHKGKFANDNKMVIDSSSGTEITLTRAEE
ncbi:MAG: hypothetical protein P8L44_06605 [Opitutales bacterium]|jgi:hypothetical protein|nr:hypothetical protein [Opitutales bacterium]